MRLRSHPIRLVRSILCCAPQILLEIKEAKKAKKDASKLETLDKRLEKARSERKTRVGLLSNKYRVIVVCVMSVCDECV